MPLAPEKGVEIPVREAIDRRGQLALKGEAPHLAVRDDVEPGLLLQGEGLVDGRVLHLARSVCSAIAPASSRSRASSRKAGRSRLPTTSVRAVSTRLLY